ncbi:MAG: heat-shock protein [Candidatus Marinarcus sp.]|uniref:heat-shock protein n=1 Tax=Candidatus Marinarcus sp. TaxID=3100987 RepID=UPI003AFF9CEC
MKNKKEFLLESIIKAYIEHLEPIGSSQLKSMYDITYSPATIRGYFKKLGDEGFLAQEHVSSGRTPTTEALKQYWLSRLNFKLDFVNIKSLEYLAKEIGLTVFIKNQISDTLQKIINVDNRYMILEFSTFPVTIKYSDALFRFLNEMTGFEIFHIMKIARQVGAYEVYEKINQIIQSRDFDIYNIKEFLNLALRYDFDDATINMFLSGKILDTCKEGLYFEELFPAEYMGICHNCIISGIETKIFVVGELSKDYEYFFNRITIV